MVIFHNAGASINDAVRVQFLDNDDLDTLAPFAILQPLQLCSIVDTNLGKIKLNILKWIHIVCNLDA